MKINYESSGLYSDVIVLKGKVNGHDSSVFLDTGNVIAFSCVLSSACAKKINHKDADKEPIPPAAMVGTTLESLSIGDLSFTDLDCVISKTPENITHRDVNIGSKFLSTQIFEIDFPNKTVDFGADEITESEESIDFTVLDQYTPLFDVMINGKGPFKFMFDTGATGFVACSEVIQASGLEFQEVFAQIELNDRVDIVPVQIANPNIKIGNIEREMQMFVMDEMMTQLKFHKGEQIDGIIPGSFFNQNILKVDFPNRKILIS
jgi:predicted aspartyl protease